MLSFTSKLTPLVQPLWPEVSSPWPPQHPTLRRGMPSRDPCSCPSERVSWDAGDPASLCRSLSPTHADRQRSDAREDLVAGIGQLLDERGRVYGFRDLAQQERRFGERPHIFFYGLECHRLPPARKRLFEERLEACTKLFRWQAPDVVGVEDL